MRLLLDTHIVLAILRKDVAQRFPDVAQLLADDETEAFVSVASLWETAIKTRLGKLDPGMPLEDMAQSLEAAELSFLQIELRHVLAAADPEPETRDPFDRLLLAQCQIEGLRLVTIDRALENHPMALQF
ncbi:type II toxin-antitoxin system VapC family toxin [Rhizobium sp. RAF56]|jgi:PIN domain nuclease of toxin-antitoxin system|uniref:type II toxin-antitoxin system VapC family toxin n=1 Tax=Rhizobium sp. RAF56 TaxID=3233062 RepID=UPI003F972240